MKLGAVDSSLGIYLMTEKSLKSPANRPSGKGCSTSHHLKLSPFRLNDFDRIAQNVNEREGKEEVGFLIIF